MKRSHAECLKIEELVGLRDRCTYGTRGTATDQELKKKVLFSGLLWGLGALSGGLYVAAFPPYTIPEAAFVFAIPLIVAGFFKLSGLRYALFAWVIGTGSWLTLIAWLRHVTIGGWILLSLILGLFFSTWFIAARPYVKGLLIANPITRLIGFTALAGLWVGLEGIRGVIFTGFPWLPLAASQVKQPLLLSILPYTGTAGLGVFILFFNFALLSYGWGLANRRNKGGRFILCADLYVALIGLAGLGYLFLQIKPQADQEEVLFRAGIVQPYTPATLKWDPNESGKQLLILQRLTKSLNTAPIDVVIWPEAATPMPVKGDRAMCHWVEQIVADLKHPVWMGNIAYDGTCWENGCFVATPTAGLMPEYYAKQHLVPFGEYVPLRKLWPWIEKVIPLPGDTRPGTSAEPLTVNVAKRSLKMGCLVCYEDVFAELARATTLAGADFFLVVTNDAWYGEEGAAQQHFAHSVLRAVETRRPFIRVGNAGQSGWIDAFGRIRETLIDPVKGPYFRGTGILTVTQDKRLQGALTPYTQRGEGLTWAFLGLSISFMLITWRRFNNPHTTDRS